MSKPANTTVVVNTTPTVVVTPTPTPAPTTTTTTTTAKSTSYPPASSDNWIVALFNYIWVEILAGLYLSLIAWWWIPIDAILFGNWTDFYVFFTGQNAAFGSYVKSYTTVINP